jgi:hypothetical protein
VDAATTGGNGVDIELHHLSVRVELGQQSKGLGICHLLAELGAMTAPLITK